MATSKTTAELCTEYNDIRAHMNAVTAIITARLDEITDELSRADRSGGMAFLRALAKDGGADPQQYFK
jgi:hypothetical protein